MLVRTAIFAALVALAATQIPALIQPRSEPQQLLDGSTTLPRSQPVAITPGRVRLQADQRGHFNGTFRMNGKPVEGVIDTGASLVAINESTARRLGFGANSLDFRYAVNTANGKTEAAHVVLDRVEIGAVRVENVDAFVMRDKALSSTLVGMSFLKKLKSYQAQSDTLTLSQ